jgi:hypothetical protein
MSNVVAAQIRLLRKKLADHGCDGLIDTVYGIGYRFNAAPKPTYARPFWLTRWRLTALYASTMGVILTASAIGFYAPWPKTTAARSTTAWRPSPAPSTTA